MTKKQMNEATRNAISEFNKIMETALEGHKRELARAEWEHSDKEMIS